MTGELNQPFELDTIVCGDCLDVMGAMDDNVVDTIITDPPYGLKFMGKDWDHGIPGVRYWCEALRVAKPGAFLLAFGGTRTWHRLACAIEDAGWEVRDTLMWLTGQGFPKSHNIAKAIDDKWAKESYGGWCQCDEDNGVRIMQVEICSCCGKPKKPTGQKYVAPRQVERGTYKDEWPNASSYEQENKIAAPKTNERGLTITAPATEAAAQWDGYGTALKPAWEPVIVAMKPLDGTFAANALAWGCAGLWIDGGRVGIEENERSVIDNRSGLDGGQRNGIYHDGWYRAEGERFKSNPQGRWPANVALLHAEGCERVGTRRVRPGNGGGYITKSTVDPQKSSIFGIGGKATDLAGYVDPDGLETVDEWQCVPDCPARMLGEQSGERVVGGERASRKTAGDFFGQGGRSLKGYADTGTAARFFYQAKASRSERNAGCDDFYWKRDGKELVRVDRDEWETLPDRQRAQGNIHPTVKPLGMLEYLCKLTRTPTGGIVFDPFIGSGTTAIAAIRTGRRFYGCDINQDYVDLANARIEKTRLELSQMEFAL